MRRNLLFILLLFIASCKPIQLAVIKQNEKYGFINKKGQIVLQPTWDFILQGYGAKIFLVEKDSLFGFINRNGQIIIEPKYKNANTFSEGLAAVYNGEKWGFINKKNDTIIAFQFDEVFDGFNNGLSDIKIKDRSGYIDKKGNVIIPLEYEDCYPFLSNYANVTTLNFENKVINKKGEIVNNKSKFKNKRLWLAKASDWNLVIETPKGKGWLNKNFDTIVKPIYKSVGVFKERRSIVNYNDKWGVVDDKGKIIVKPIFDEIWHYSEGFANFKLNGKWGYIDRQGSVVIEPKFDYAGQFTKGFAYFESDGKSGFINKKGQIKIRPIFEINRTSRFD